MRDVAIIGAGFGGLGAALRLSELGADVILCESLKYPGGCASTFTRRKHRFESGATLFSGFGEGQLFQQLIARYKLDVEVDILDPMVELRAPGFTLAVPPDREGFLSRMAALSGADAPRVRAFFKEQERVASALWSLFSDPALLPPFDLRALLRHAGRAPRYLPLLRLIGQPLTHVLARHGLEDARALRVFLDAVCQITVQAAADEVEAPFAMAAMDYYFRGTGHVRGGIGTLAWALVSAIEHNGGEVVMSNPVRAIRRERGAWTLTTRRGEIRARRVVANMLPQGVTRLSGQTSRELDALTSSVEDGWGAAMLYRVLEPGEHLGDHAHHLELVSDASAPFIEGNHVFVSISDAREDRGPDEARTATLSTHVPMKKLRAEPDPGEYIAGVQARMRDTIAQRAPELRARFEMPGSPRTFERFTGRDHGYVGGIPRRVGLHHYTRMWPRPVLPDLYLVGDTVFPGQSTLGTALGGIKLAEFIRV